MPWTLYYDGGCSLCTESKTRIERWASRSGVAMEALPLQSVSGFSETFGDNLVLIAEGRTFVGGDAWLKAFELAPAPVRALRLLGYTAPTRWLVGVLYRLVAAIRYLFGRRECGIGRPR